MKQFLTIATLGGLGAWACLLAASWTMLGRPGMVTIDITTIAYTLTGGQLVIAAAGLIAAFVCVSYSIAATIQLAAAPEIGVVDALWRSSSTAMQVFWLQGVVYILAVRFSPYAAILMWMFAAFATPVALLENLGLNAAFDRAWELSRGNRIKILALELFLPLIPIAAAVLVTIPARPGGQLESMSTTTRLAVSWLLPVVTLIAAQIVPITLTKLYKALTTPEPALHARAASGVK